MELVNLKINPSPIFPPLLSGIFGVINAADHLTFIAAIHIINKNGICFASNAEAYHQAVKLLLKRLNATKGVINHLQFNLGAFDVTQTNDLHHV